MKGRLKMPTPKKILIADDEANLTKFMEIALAESGYDTHIANTGLAALREVREHYFDLILLDLNMPEIDGIHVAKVTKEHRPNTKIIVVTGRKDQYEDELKSIQVDDMIQKPVRMNDLLEKVKQILGPSPVIPKPAVTSGIPKARILFIDHDDTAYDNLFYPYFKNLNSRLETKYELFFTRDKNQAITLIKLNRPDMVFIGTKAIEMYPDIQKEIQSTVAIPKEIIVHGMELYAKSPDELGLDRDKVTAIEGGMFNEDYPKRLAEVAREIAYRHGLVEP